MVGRNYSHVLNPQKALIWRIVHRDNIPWILENGLHSSNSPTQCVNWVQIGSPELIEKRQLHPVPVGKKGVLSDYIPFYFTPFSPMLLNIKSGRGGVRQRTNDEIVILVSSLYQLQQQQIPFVFTNSHAYYQWAEFYTDLSSLNEIDWSILQARDFKRDMDDPAKFERYQAEALVHQHCPTKVLIGVICYTETVKAQIEQWLQQADVNIPVHVRQGVYF
ncbi:MULTISPECIES: DUF4433 domain-containing protein [Acinetobacter calcoaceticus/baumannii complex]|uniref:type II toxin-antitoxin system toxin DNA ADP-ribosyl transferase DarT n=1 Tax=Acinetobacter calcoaceticus/baumannii complex TaxID=909768 RepID=UPI000FB059FF|nr:MULTISPECIES: DUF4433 domain-containing protein [Acinetobacter calcoaceticus/baumannii complex]MDC5426847.1 DUF4433 domain-containing protein [Acinetobacter baumannii]QRF07249.1 DUF4433 domain-containing protein [Acinetobacter pittii]RUT42768.1 DUF4433 domain-containing protein [Acinetobacter baumannii]